MFTLTNQDKNVAQLLIFNDYELLDQEQLHVDGILVIVDTPESLRPLLKILSSSENVQKPFVVYIISVGLKICELSRLETLKMVVMQEAT